MSKLRRQPGFTLLELMVSLTVMAITMTVVLKAVSGQQDHLRYAQTVERVERIKKGILDVSSVNGVASASGFVADMGRLPNNLHELLERDYCPSDITALKTDTVPATCKTGETPVSNMPWQSQTICQDPDIDPAHCAPPLIKATLSAGWNGPYVQTPHHPGHVSAGRGADALTDGWGNEGYNPPRAYPAKILSPDPRHNYGWNYCNTFAEPKSLGCVNQQPGVTVYSYGNGCHIDAALCKGNSTAPDLLDFGYPLSASANLALAYDANGKSITPDGILTPDNPSLPPAPIISENQWQAVIGDVTADYGSGMGVNVTLQAKPPTCTSPNLIQCVAAGLATASSTNPPCFYVMAKSEKACQQLGGDWKDPVCTGPGLEQCQKAHLVTDPPPGNLPTPPCTLAAATSSAQCLEWGGNWKIQTAPLCLNIYYIEDGHLSVVSANGAVPEDGGLHTVHFVFPRTSFPGSGITVTLPAGNAAFSVHSSSGMCSSFYTNPRPPPPPNGTDGETYPTSGRQAVPVKILPGQTPSFTW